MYKNESVRRFGDFTAVNSRSRNSYGTTEKTEIFKFEYSYNALGIGTYRRINRPWQRYDYESSLQGAFDNLLEIITRKQYEEWREDIEKIRLALKKMENYEGTPK